MTVEIYRALQRAVELGKWPNGVPLTREQLEICIQAALLYESRHLGGSPISGAMGPGGAPVSPCPGPRREGDGHLIARLRMH